MASAFMQNGSLPPDVDRGPRLLPALWVLFPLATLLLGTRLYARIARKTFGVDDALMIAAWSLYVIHASIVTEGVHLGGYRHMFYIQPANLTHILKLMYASMAFAVISAMFGKISVAWFMARLFGQASHWRMWFLRINIGLYFCIAVTSVVLMFEQCRPVKANWEPELQLKGEATCLNRSVNPGFSMFNSAYGAFLDFALSILPITYLWKLPSESKKRRAAIAALLGLGIIAGICAIIKICQISKTWSSIVDATWNTWDLFLWSALEMQFIIIAGSIPHSKPVWDLIVNGKPMKPPSDNDRSYENGGSSPRMATTTYRSYQATETKGGDHWTETIGPQV